ncbi:MAG: gas vesicle protein GvpG [Deltaproteobacteria bacterium]|nr:gas vesicle protein GvpG [Deltaproteobacteria bacterium]
MFVLDDILLFPVRSIGWIFRQVKEAAAQELEARSTRITEELGRLYARLEAGELTEEEFDAREKELLDELERVQESRGR